MASPIEVFFSYAHEDEALRDELAKHLRLLQRRGVIQSWHDRQIGAGIEWEAEIAAHLESARIILLLISADFLDSDFCYDNELKRALERHKNNTARVIPIILRDCDWQEAEFGKLQALPKNAKPVTSWANLDEAWTDVVRGIRNAIERLQNKADDEGRPGSPPKTQPQSQDDSPAPSQMPANPDAHRLHQRCNRTAQTDAFEDTLRQHRNAQPHRPLLYLIHGDESECHDLLLDRLKGEILPEELNCSITDCLWNNPPHPQSSVNKFWLSLGKHLLNRRFDPTIESHQQIQQELARLGGPLLVRLQWYSDQFGQAQTNGLANFLQFWESWPPLPEHCLVICTLSLVYAESKAALSRLTFWRQSPSDRLKEWVKELADHEQPTPSLSLSVLPELEPVAHHEAKRWCHDLDVTRRDHVMDGVVEFFQRRDNRPIDMRTLAKELKKLLADKELSIQSSGQTPKRS